MKKIFSTVAMAVVAFVSVVSMASCTNDSPSSFNAAPSFEPLKSSTTTSSSSNSDKPVFEKNTYSLAGVITDDALALYDVQITVKNGNETKTFVNADFSQSTKLVYNYGFGKVEYAGKAMNSYSFKGENGAVSVKASFTLKANFKDILASMNKESVDLYFQPNYKTPNSLGNGTAGNNPIVSFCTESRLNEIGANLADILNK